MYQLILKCIKLKMSHFSKGKIRSCVLLSVLNLYVVKNNNNPTILLSHHLGRLPIL